MVCCSGGAKCSQMDEELEQPVCRICNERDDASAELGALVVACACAGSLKYIHARCLEQWISSRPAHPYSAQELRQHASADVQLRAGDARLEQARTGAPSLPAASARDSLPPPSLSSASSPSSYLSSSSSMSSSSPPPPPATSPCAELAASLGPVRFAAPIGDRRFRCEICAARYRVLLEEEFECDGAHVFAHASVCHAVEAALLVTLVYFAVVSWPLVSGTLATVGSGALAIRAILLLAALVAVVAVALTLRRIVRAWRSTNSAIVVVPDSDA